ncbi:NAD(P)H-hydrate dehydratase [Alkalimonas amylolytica]|uniref:Bifunctional NAD(P)H-hydrate repair enzyme n=1 Tax=Alkalimonas amylolytica TaxID=152573 RepID=A0A1H4AV41_ALKAM|nr:NAD(P)H-hydrate dehydratase [Alkalimonas amylolytica]SEA39779.1 NAD(P)H-hydrate epimerase [Alkalimonas amylolytica]
MTDRLYSSKQIRAIEQQAIAELAQGDFALMQQAASALLGLLKQRWPSRKSLLVYAGNGNNGGDGYLLAAYAKTDGYQVAIKCTGDHNRLPKAALMARQVAEQAQVPLLAPDAPFKADVLVDALFGIGLNRPVAGDYASAIEQINRSAGPVLAVDVPSGLCADTGQVLGSAVKASVTLSFIGHKIGLFTADGPDHCGDLRLEPLSIPKHLLAAQEFSARLVSGPQLLSQLKPRLANFHKGQAGHVVILGGDAGMAGAPLLSAEAALRCGAGVVTVLTRKEHVAALVARRPECMVHGVEAQQDLHPFLLKANVIVAGPGLGQQFWGQQLLQQVLAQNKAVLLDADALNLLAHQAPPQVQQLILTPHPGEAARLLQCNNKDVQQNRLEAVKLLQHRYQATVVLKGHGSLIADAHGVQLLNAGNPGMASAGMGDLLSGIIAALWAQGLSASDATALGCWLHATAADQLAASDGQRGLLALDLLTEVRALLNQSNCG